MPELRLHFQESLISKENIEDMLTIMNKDVKDNSDKFTSRNKWFRSILRNYALVSKNSRERYESTKKLTIRDKTIKVEKLEPWEGTGADILVDSFDGYEIILPIGKLQMKWLSKGFVWENTIKKYLEEVENETDINYYSSLADLCRDLILTSLLRMQTRVDLEKLKDEEEDLNDPYDEDNEEDES